MGVLSSWSDVIHNFFLGYAEGQNLRYCGIGAGYDDVIVNGDLDEPKA